VAGLQENNAMLAGFARRDITPAPDVFLAGNGEYQSEGIHDPLAARTLVLADGPIWAAIVSCDLIGIEAETTRAVREHLRRAGIGSPEHLAISCTHTHNGPHTRFSKKTFLLHRDETYLTFLAKQIAEAIIEADANRTPVSLRYARGWACENFNRRLIEPDGQARFYNPSLVRERPELAQQTHGVADRELDALQLVRPDGSVLVTAVQYAAHPVTVGIAANLISADYCGALVRRLEEELGAPALFLQGACGDLHPRGLFAGFDRMEEMAASLCAESLRVLAGAAPLVVNPRLAVARHELLLPTRFPVEGDTARGNALSLWNTTLFEQGYQVEMLAFSLGPIAWVSAPGELLCEPGLQIKWNSPFPQTWILYNCNSYSSYLAPPRAYHEGGYEGESGQCLTPEACLRVLRTAETLLSEISPPDLPNPS